MSLLSTCRSTAPAPARMMTSAVPFLILFLVGVSFGERYWVNFGARRSEPCRVMQFCEDLTTTKAVVRTTEKWRPWESKEGRQPPNLSATSKFARTTIGSRGDLLERRRPELYGEILNKAQ